MNDLDGLHKRCEDILKLKQCYLALSVSKSVKVEYISTSLAAQQTICLK